MNEHEPLGPSTFDEPDRTWDQIREEIVQQLHESGAWTDHNISDPGITMLEAVALSLADLHYRTGLVDFSDATISTRFWDPEPSHWSEIDLPSDTVTLADLADQLRANYEAILQHINSAADRSHAISSVVNDSANSLTWAQAAAIVRLIRLPVVRRGALDLAGAIEAAYEMSQRDSASDQQIQADAIELLRNDPSFDGLWDAELADLFRLRARRRLVERVMRLARTIPEVSDTCALIEDLTVGHDLLATELVGALAIHPTPAELSPEFFEDTTGKTSVWPPHPIQTRTTEPVIDSDYVTLALQVPQVRRAWVRSGHVKDAINWNRDKVKVASNDPGKSTIVIDDGGAEAEDLELHVHRALAGKGEQAEVDHPYQLERDHPHHLTPRRLICDEIAVARLQRCEIVVKAALYVTVGTVIDRRQVIAGALDRVREHFEKGRPESQPASAPSDPYDGPWPRPAPTPPGWIPGEPINLNEVIAALAGDPVILGVSETQLRRTDGGWYPAQSDSAPFVLEMDDNCVPILADKQCVTVSFVLEGE